MDLFRQLASGLSTRSPTETIAFGRNLAAALPHDCALALSGDLGTGKTTLVRGIAEGLGVRQTVTSPTFALYALYQGSRQLLHLDAYRLQSDAEAEDLMLDEFLLSPFLLVVEWPDRVADFLRSFPVFHLRLSITAPGQHHLRLLSTPHNFPNLAP